MVIDRERHDVMLNVVRSGAMEVERVAMAMTDKEL